MQQTVASLFLFLQAMLDWKLKFFGGSDSEMIGEYKWSDSDMCIRLAI